MCPQCYSSVLRVVLVESAPFAIIVNLQQQQKCILLGATSVSLHNGGGTGWGESINGGFLLCLDGTVISVLLTTDACDVTLCFAHSMHH